MVQVTRQEAADQSDARQHEIVCHKYCRARRGMFTFTCLCLEKDLRHICVTGAVKDSFCVYSIPDVYWDAYVLTTMSECCLYSEMTS